MVRPRGENADHELPKRVFNSKMQNRRSMGRPRKLWENEVAEDARNLLGISLWRSAAMDRRERERTKKKTIEKLFRMAMNFNDHPGFYLTKHQY